jgi:WD40 repeat protein
MNNKTKMKILTTLLLIIYYSNCWCLKKVFKVNSNVSAIDYSPDGTMIAVGGDDSIVRIFDSTYYNSISTYSNGQPIYSLKFSPNNLMLAIGYSNGAKVLNVPGLQLNATIGVSTIVYSVDFSINSTYLSTCGTSSNQLLVFETVGWSQVGNSQNTQGNMHFRKC